MPRPLRLDYPNAHFHITARGVERRAIYLDASDRLSFLKILTTACKRYGCRCHAYCLMGNHYHLLLESVEGRLASAMQHLNGNYGRWFNHRRERVGHLFQGRFSANLLDRDDCVLEVVRYIELNPCRARLVMTPEDWEWSSFRPRIGLDPPPPCLTVEDVLNQFGPRRGANGRYRRFVLDGLSDQMTRKRLHEETIIGSDEFVSRHAKRAREFEKTQTVPRAQRLADRPELASIVGGVEGPALRQCAARAFIEHGYSMIEIARTLDVHYTTISRWVRRHGI